MRDGCNSFVELQRLAAHISSGKDKQRPSATAIIAPILTSATLAQLEQSYFPSTAAALRRVLAASGIYGMAAYAISRRRREIGIRVAIGAQPRQILRVLFGRTSVSILAGSLAGFLLGLAAGPVLVGVVYQASPNDPVVIMTALLAMASVALLAAAGPARRALRIDPIHALREE
jgi:ABC-type antimicrobial peptide transport system permease subunit